MIIYIYIDYAKLARKQAEQEQKEKLAKKNGKDE